MKAAFFVTTPAADEPRVQTLFGYAMAAAAMDYDTLIFLALDGAMLTKRKVVDNLTVNTRDRVLEAMRNGVQVAVCSQAAQTYGIKKEDMLDGVKIWGIASFLDFASNADIMLSWS
jgi:predicted peroxiredoxin